MANNNTQRQILWEACSYTEDGQFDGGVQHGTRTDAEKDLKKYPGHFLVKVTYERVTK